MASDLDLPSPPFLDIPGIANFRDIGGYPSSGNGSSESSVRRGLVFRSADPSKVLPEGSEKMKELGIKKVFDLRSIPEIKRDGPEWEGVEVDTNKFDSHNAEGSGSGIQRVWTPVFAGDDYSPEQIALRYKEYTRAGSEGFVKAYKDISAAAPNAYRTILLHLAQPSPEPCVVHCTAGKDRTGLLVASLYLLCDVPSEVIVKEYALTDSGLANSKPLFMERSLKNPLSAGEEAGTRRMTSSKPENMRASLTMIEEVYGGAETYCRERIGFDDATLEQSRKNSTESTPPTL